MIPGRHRNRAIAAVLAVVALLGSACGGGDDDGADESGATPTTARAAASTTSTTGPSGGDPCTGGGRGPMRIVLVNDDGVVNPAIDVLIDHLASTDALDVDVTVVAPAEERSGSSDRTTPGGATYEQGTTVGGNDAYAVDGFPADAVLVALDELDLDPHLVLSGINPTHNFGPIAVISGTVGAARTAIREGVPALAVSAGQELDEEQFRAGAELATDWIVEHCEALMSGTHPTDTLASINVPACPPAQMGPLQEVPRATALPELPEGESIFESTCDLSDPAPADDVAAVRSGYPSLTRIGPDL